MKPSCSPHLIPRTSSRRPHVSIICTSFNHVDYIEQALRSFINQKAQIEFEIIVHDDASTDGTREVLKQWQQRHPNRISLILQTENQYSKGGFNAYIFATRYASSDILMLCDGDDYWTSEKKLERQYSKLETHKDIDICFHPSIELIEGVTGKILCRYSEDEHVFSANQVIMGTGGFCPTGSIMIRKSIIDSIPADLLGNLPIVDAFIQAMGAMRGGALFLPEPECVYRIDSSSSLSRQVEESGRVRRKAFMLSMSNAYKILRRSSPYNVRWSLFRMERKYYRKAKKLRTTNHPKRSL